MKISKKIISLTTVFATLFSCLVVPVHANGISDSSYSHSSFWDWVMQGAFETHNSIVSIFDKDTCPKCPNESGLHNFVERHTQVDGQTGDYYVCEYCGKSAGEVAKPA